ncbi:MAG: YkgJ family cysteine cluster protein [Bacteroidota bacterium]
MNYLSPSSIQVKEWALEGSNTLKSIHNQLKSKASKDVDDLFFKHAQKITELVDCTTCGNCCKLLEAGLSDDEIAKLSIIKNERPEHFKRLYLLKENGSDAWYLKETPCTFLKSDCKCAIYEDRPKACINYPGLNHPGIKYRLRSVWANYEICPIVYASVEAVKTDLANDL